MVKNQLFRVLPDIDIINILLESVGLSSLEDTNFFTKETIKELNTVEKINEIKGILESYYLPCKSKVYLNKLNEKKRITILRQFLKVHNYTLMSKEKYIKGKKSLFYQVIPIQIDMLVKERNDKVVISFD